MKRRRDERTLLSRDDATIGQTGKFGRFRANRSDCRRPDEDRVDGFIPENRHGDIGFEALLLPPKRIALHHDIHDTDQRLIETTNIAGQNNRTSAGAHDGQSRADSRAQRFKHVKRDKQLANGRALAARNDQAIDVIEVAWKAHLNDFMAKAFKRLTMGEEIPLHRQNTDFLGQSLPAPHGQQVARGK